MPGGFKTVARIIKIFYHSGIKKVDAAIGKENNIKKNATYSVNIKTENNVVTVYAGGGKSLLDVLRRKGMVVIAPCGGDGICKKCHVEIEGEGSCLACQYRIKKDITVVMPSPSQMAILDLTSEYSRKIINDSGMSLSREGSSVWLQYRNRGIIRIKKELSDNFSCYGIALDIGTTTVVLYLIDLFSYRVLDTISFLNPQRIYGHDVISRIRYCMQDVKYILQFQQLIIDSISKSIYAICKKNKIRNDRIFKITVVGNTTMLHLFLAEDPSSIALAPFTPRFTQAKLLSGTELHLGINKKAIVHILPSLSGYIGADIIAGVASTPMTDEEAYSLFIDIGTNGEIVLGNSKVIYCCSTAAGPAFEGAAIHDGTGAVEGAISEYHDGHYHTIGNKMPLGICGSGLVDLVAALLKSGKVDKQGYMAENFLVSAKADTALGKDIILTPKDIREVQLAKAAIYAGITLLVRIAEIGYEDIRSVFLAGGFGNYMNIASAMKIGLLPKALKDKVYPVGNSAGTGALFALKSIAFEKYIKKVLKKARYIELSMRQDFYDIYMESMHFE